MTLGICATPLATWDASRITSLGQQWRSKLHRQLWARHRIMGQASHTFVWPRALLQQSGLEKETRFPQVPDEVLKGIRSAKSTKTKNEVQVAPHSSSPPSHLQSPAIMSSSSKHVLFVANSKQPNTKRQGCTLSFHWDSLVAEYPTSVMRHNNSTFGKIQAIVLLLALHFGFSAGFASQQGARLVFGRDASSRTCMFAKKSSNNKKKARPSTSGFGGAATESCPCGSDDPYMKCCGKLHKNVREFMKAEPEQVVRARYSAYAKREIDFIIKSTHPKNKNFDADIKV